MQDIKSNADREIGKILNHLNVTIDETRLNCMQKHKNIKFLRKSIREASKFDVFRQEHLDIIDECIKIANKMVIKRFGKPLPLKEYSYMRREKGRCSSFSRGKLEH